MEPDVGKLDKALCRAGIFVFCRNELNLKVLPNIQ